MHFLNIIKKINIRSGNRGQFIVEFLVAMGFAAVVLPAILTGLIITRSGKAQHEQRLGSIELLKEASEAVRIVREGGWNFIEENGIYHPVINLNTWALASGPDEINGYTRSVEIEDAMRLNNAIVESGGTPDLSTKKITITVSWLTPLPSSISEVFYLTRFKNISHTTTTVEDFNRGSNTNTVIVNNLGGEVVLGAGGGGNWCDPNLSIATVDLPKQGVANAIAAIEGQVIAGTGENASGVSFARINVSNANPPSGKIVGEYSGFKTNDVFNEADYSYIATDTNSKEVVILNTQSVPYAEAGYFNAPENGNGDSIFVSSNIGYMTSANMLYTFDLTNKTESRSQLGSLDLGSVGKDIVVIGEYAYIAVDSTSNQLLIVKVSDNGTKLDVVGQANLNGQGGIRLFVNSSSTHAYVATAASSTQPEMFIIDISGKTGSQSTIGSYDSNGMDPKGITVVPGRAILVGESGEEYQVINIIDEKNLTKCGGLGVDSGVRGVASIIESDGDAYSYIITGDSNAELKIIEGGPGGQFSLTGEFESDILDASSSAFFNRILFNFNKPALSDINFQVAGADAINNSCSGANFVYVGEDGTSSTYFTDDGQIPANDDGEGYENPARCFRFKAFLSSQDLIFTPTLYDVIVNYSP